MAYQLMSDTAPMMDDHPDTESDYVTPFHGKTDLRFLSNFTILRSECVGPKCVWHIRATIGSDRRPPADEQHQVIVIGGLEAFGFDFSQIQLSIYNVG